MTGFTTRHIGDTGVGVTDEISDRNKKRVGFTVSVSVLGTQNLTEKMGLGFRELKKKTIGFRFTTLATVYTMVPVTFVSACSSYSFCADRALATAGSACHIVARHNTGLNNWMNCPS